MHANLIWKWHDAIRLNNQQNDLTDRYEVNDVPDAVRL